MGQIRFVYLYRRDVAAQAVSWARAEQTQIWHDSGDGEQNPAREPAYKFDEIHGYARLIDAHNEAWDRWFLNQGIRPHRVVYEDLDGDPVGTVQRVLRFLGLGLPQGQRIAASNRRMADRVSALWTERYRAYSGRT